MTRHVLTIRYDGLLAAQHAMNGADSKIVTDGAVRFLGALAHYWISEEVPDRIYATTRHFEIHHVALRPGSVLYEFGINIAANAMWDAAKFGFAVFVYEQFKAWRTRREIEMPEYARREPMLDAPGPGNRPVFDPTDGRELQRHRLHDRITHAMHQITVPLARHATTAELIFDGRPLGTFTRRTPRWTKEEINTAPTVYFQGLRAGAPQTGA